MDFTGTITQLLRDFYGRVVVSLSINENPGNIEKLQGKQLDIKIVEHKKKRSLDANAYFHVLCDKLRQKHGMSMARMKNHLIADYGQIMYIEEGIPLIYKTNAPPEFINELEEPHLLLVKTEIERGKEVYFYRMYRGSHTYNTWEMSKLIDGTITECKDVGIETLTPIQLKRMMDAWERKNGKREQEAKGS